jgi:hypothetical protein
MKPLSKLAAAAAALLFVAGCGEQRGADGLTGEERQKLNEIAVQSDSQDVDASPDSLVANGGDEWTAAESGEAPANAGDAATNGAAAADQP